MNILNRNLEILRKHNRNLAVRFENYLSHKNLKSDIDRILLARNGELVINMLVEIKGSKFILCDQENPLNEAKEWVKKYFDPYSKTHIVFGLGFGFHIELLMSACPEAKIVIIEPDMELFYQIMQVRNLEMILKNCILYVQEDYDCILRELEILLWDIRTGGIQFEPFPVYTEIFEEKWNQIRDGFIRQSQSFNVDVATRRNSSFLWLKNNIINLKSIDRASSAKVLENEFRDVPAIIVSAGPSLDKNITQLKNLKDRCLIIASGSAANILEYNGIQPHMIVAIDANDSESRIHKSLKSKRAYFLHSNQVSPESVEAYPDNRFIFCLSNDFYTRKFYEYNGQEYLSALSGPSVSNTSIDLALKFGCSPIILIGQDLSYNKGKTYASGAVSTDINIQQRNVEIEKDIFGNDVETDAAFLAMRNWFIDFAAKNKKTRILNCTEGGLPIEGIPNALLEDTLNEFIKTFSLEEKLKSLFEKGTNSTIKELTENYTNRFAEYLNTNFSSLLEQTDFVLKRMKSVNLSDRKSIDLVEGYINQAENIFSKLVSDKIWSNVIRNIVELDVYIIRRNYFQKLKQCNKFLEYKNVYFNMLTELYNVLREKLKLINKIL